MYCSLMGIVLVTNEKPLFIDFSNLFFVSRKNYYKINRTKTATGSLVEYT